MHPQPTALQSPALSRTVGRRVSQDRALAAPGGLGGEDVLSQGIVLVQESGQPSSAWFQPTSELIIKCEQMQQK